MIEVGLTGGIGSGKSTVAEIFKVLDVPVYNSDNEAKRIMKENPDVRLRIIELLGNESYINQELNRKWIATKVFNNKTLLNSLNQIVHPAVFEDYKEWKIRISNKNPYIIKETALLLDILKHSPVDQIISVFTPREIRIQRIIDRDKVSLEQAVERMKNQKTDKEFIDASDYIIVNDGLHALTPQIIDIHQKLINNDFDLS